MLRRRRNVNMVVVYVFYSCSLEYTFRTIFWALFGLKDAKTVELGQGFQSRFTESVGYIVFGVYNWGAVIVLLNMLIAMMTRSFDKIAVSLSDRLRTTKRRGRLSKCSL